MLVGQLSLVALLIYAADAAVTTWHRGDRHHALAEGGSIVFFALFSTLQSLLVLWEIVKTSLSPQPVLLTCR